MKLKIACIQVNPIIGQVERNISKIWSLLNHVKDPDIIILPELAITGYNFLDKKSIKPYLESQSNSRSISLAKEISENFKCFTLIGYPEISKGIIFNSAAFISPNGSMLQNYRKTFLYSSDEAWGCEENPEKDFRPVDIVFDKEYYLGKNPEKSYQTIRTNIGICMDLNPYKFEAPFNEFEFSMSCFENKTKLILCPMAWLSPQSPSLATNFSENEKLEKVNLFTHEVKSASDPQLDIQTSPTDFITKNVSEKATSTKPDQKMFYAHSPSISTVDYWILRFFPFMSHPYNKLKKYFDSVTLVTCNRVGIETDVLYGGSSSIIQFKDGPVSSEIDSTNPSVKVAGCLGQGVEGILVREVDVNS